jgi:hypothetical protein
VPLAWPGYKVSVQRVQVRTTATLAVKVPPTVAVVRREVRAVVVFRVQVST